MSSISNPYVLFSVSVLIGTIMDDIRNAVLWCHKTKWLPSVGTLYRVRWWFTMITFIKIKKVYCLLGLQSWLVCQLAICIDTWSIYFLLNTQLNLPVNYQLVVHKHISCWNLVVTDSWSPLLSILSFLRVWYCALNRTVWSSPRGGWTYSKCCLILLCLISFF